MPRPDDEFDDRDDRDDRRDRDRDDDDDRGGDRVKERARAKVGTPSMLLLIAGILALLMEIGAIGLMATNPTAIYDWYVDMIKKQPDSPERKKLLDDMEKQKDSMRLDAPLNIGAAAVGLIANLLVIVGAMKMRSLSGYPLALTGAIAGIIPVGGCCCLTMPLGIWALVVLVNQDVKRAFARSRTPRDGY